MVVRVTWKQALAWRMRRQLLDPLEQRSVPDVVRRLCGVQAQVASSAELAVRLRQERSRPGDIGRALAKGRLIKTWAMRGSLHVLSPEDAGAFLSVVASGRSWETPSWERYFGMTADRWDRLRPAVREALAGRILTREELIAAIVKHPGLEHLDEPLRSGWGSLLKPLAWQGDLCYGPARANGDVHAARRGEHALDRRARSRTSGAGRRPRISRNLWPGDFERAQQLALPRPCVEAADQGVVRGAR